MMNIDLLSDICIVLFSLKRLHSDMCSHAYIYLHWDDDVVKQGQARETSM